MRLHLGLFSASFDTLFVDETIVCSSSAVSEVLIIIIIIIIKTIVCSSSAVSEVSETCVMTVVVRDGPGGNVASVLSCFSNIS